MYKVADFENLSDFYKDEPNNIVWEVEDLDSFGKLLFSFDKENIYNLWTDYPHEFSKEEREIFDKEYPYWANFFRDRK